MINFNVLNKKVFKLIIIKVYHLYLKKTVLVIYMLSVLALPACKVSYSLSGASISPEVETISVQFFQNRAPVVQPTLSQQFTDALRDKFRSQTKLTMINGYGDVNFEGEITGYDTRPVAIQANETAAQTRLTVTVRVKYTNSVEPEQDFDTSFSRYRDFSSNEDISAVEGSLVPEIIDELTEDIFNRAFVNW